MSEITTSQQKWALLIGINTYPNLVELNEDGSVKKARHLGGCVNDVTVMRGVLEEQFKFPPENITMLTEEAATRDGILQAMNALVERVEDNDIVVMVYAGHGSRRPDAEGDEPDGYDSTLVPYDSGRAFKYNSAPNRDITDDEIYLWLGDLTRKTPYVTLVVDACKSGTIMRDDFGDNARWVEEETRKVGSAIARKNWPKLKARMEGEAWLPGDDRYVLLAGCRDDESANEHRGHGLMTYYLARILKSAGPGTIYRDVFEQLVPKMMAVKSTQHPQMEGTLDRELFGVRDIEPMVHVKVNQRTDHTVKLAAGAAQGVLTGSIWTIYREGVKDTANETPLGRVRISAVHAVDSDGVILEETEPETRPIAAACRAVETERAYRDLVLRVQVNVPETSASLKDRFAEMMGVGTYAQLLHPVAPGEEADVCVYLIAPRSEVNDGDAVPQLRRVDEATWAVVGRSDGKLLTPLHKESEPEAMYTVLDNLVKIARVRKLHAIFEQKPTPNPLDGTVTMTLQRKLADGSLVPAEPEKNNMPVFKHGDAIEITVSHTYEKPLYIYLLNIGLTLSVGQVFPPLGAHEPIGPNQSFDIGQSRWGARRIPLRVPKDFPFAQDPEDGAISEGIDTAVLLVTEEPADFSPLLQAGVRDVDDLGPRQGRDSALGRLVSAAMMGGQTRDMGGDFEEEAPPPPTLWTTVIANFILQRA